MKKVLMCGFLFSLLVSLTACPYKETYKSVTEEGVTNKGIKVKPLTLYYHSWHKRSSLDVGLILENHTDSLQNVRFSDAQLTNSRNILPLKRIYHRGDSLPPNYTFQVEPNENLAIGLEFHDSTKYFKDTVSLSFDLFGFGKYKLEYLRINR
jgi:hypothetical protein